MPADVHERAGADLLFRVDGGSTVGFGHLRRSQALAIAARRRGLRSVFLVSDDDGAREWLASTGEETRVLARDGDEPGLVAEEARGMGAVVVSLDVARPLGHRYIMTLRRAGRAVVVVENDGPGRLAAHLSVGTAAPPEQSWRGALGEHAISPSYAILGEAFRPAPKLRADAPMVLVTMGGNDPDGTTLLALAALESIDDALRRVIVVGPGFKQHGELQAALARATHQYEVHYNLPEVLALVTAADLAVANFGLSAYELAAAGVPAVLVVRQQCDRWHAQKFATAGAAAIAEPVVASIAAALRPLVLGAGLRRQFSQAAERLVDGRGTERVAEMVSRLVLDLRATGRDKRKSGRRQCAVAGKQRS
jgi:spore coat polysaccharide biosynthesis predicted glycosyltransferase SpsG